MSEQLTKDQQACSGVVASGDIRYCRHGHAFTYSCLGNGYPRGYPLPVCVREDKLFDEETRAVRITTWVGQ